METYGIDLGALLDELGAERVIGDEVDLGEVVVGDVVFQPERPAKFEVSFTNTGAGVVGDGWVRQDALTECSRCLEPCHVELTGTVEAFYVTPGHEEGVPEEQEYETIHAGRIDLGPALRAALSVDAPFAPLHDPECKGICPVCGANRNVEVCECDIDVHPDNPFSVLREMLPQDEGSAGSRASSSEDEDTD